MVAVYSRGCSPATRTLLQVRQVLCLFVAIDTNSREDIMELGGDIEHSELHLFNPNADQALSLPRKMAWMTGK